MVGLIMFRFMPRIELPPPEEEYESSERIILDDENYNRIKEFLNVEPWFCSDCNIKNFGRNENCVYCKIRKGILTGRPDGKSSGT